MAAVAGRDVAAMTMVPGATPEELQVHPAAAIFPPMAEPELRELAEDIAQHGQREPIVLLNDLILDGRNRYAACLMAGVEASTKQYDGNGSPTDFVVAMNLRRRHLSPEQRAAVAVELEGLYAAEAKEREREAGKKGGKTGGRNRDANMNRGSPDPGLGLPRQKQDHNGRSLAQAAKAVGAGKNATETLKSVKAEAPEVFDLAKAGKVNVAQAKRLAEDFEPEEREKAVEEIRSGTKPASVLRPVPKPSFDITEALPRWRDLLKREFLKCPERYRPRFVEFIRQVADELEA